MQDDEDILYVVEVLDKTQNWNPIASTMSKDKAEATLKKARTEYQFDESNSRITESTFAFPKKSLIQ